MSRTRAALVSTQAVSPELGTDGAAAANCAAITGDSLKVRTGPR